METKTCRKCGIDKPISEFHRKQSMCKCCFKEYCKVRRQSEEYRERNKEYEKKRRQSEKYKEYQKAYMIKYKQTQNYKDSIKKWKSSEKYKEYYKKYQKLEKRKEANLLYRQTEKGKEVVKRIAMRILLKNLIGAEPPKELVEAKLLINKIKKLCKTSNNLESV